MIACSVSKAGFGGLLLAAAMACASAANAASLVLDDFESPSAPAFGTPAGSGAQFFERSFGTFAGLAGQVREANYNLYHDPSSGGASASVGGGFAAVGASADALGEYVFFYGAFTRPTGDPSIAGPFMGLDLRSFDNFRLEFSDVKYGLNINVVLYTSAPQLLPDGSPLYYLQSGINIAPASEGSPLVADLYLDARNPIASSFSPYFNFSQVDGIFLVIDRSGFSSGNKYLLETLLFTQAVPEPSSYALMLGGLGIVAYVARRRRT
jgi:hypothetical protein